jgi:hypothetical protein
MIFSLTAKISDFACERLETIISFEAYILDTSYMCFFYL